MNSQYKYISRYLSRPFRERRKGKLFVGLIHDCNLRGKGSLRDEYKYKAKSTKEKKENTIVVELIIKEA